MNFSYDLNVNYIGCAINLLLEHAIQLDGFIDWNHWHLFERAGDDCAKGQNTRHID